MSAEGRLDSLLGHLYDAALDATAWPRFLESLKRTFDAEVTSFAHYDTREARHTLCEIVGDWDVERYEEHFSSRNDWVNLGKHKVAGGVVLLGEQICPQAEFERCEYYNDFLKRFHVAHLMAAVLRGTPEQFTAVSILGSKRRGTFTGAEVTLLEQILPHLRQAVRIRERLAPAGVGHDVALADTFAEGLLILDDQGGVLEANSAARRILGASGVVDLRRDGLHFRTPSLEARLRRLIRSVTAPFRLGRPTAGGTLLVTRAPCGGLAVPPGRAAAFAWVRDLNTAPASGAQWLSACFGLSPAEGRLVASLSDGCSRREATDAIGVTSHTARSQLKSALDKMGVHRQADLVRLAKVVAR
jgi:DNA-binding CsgD family transcriptional regulator/PAS domain-containing protein